MNSDRARACLAASVVNFVSRKPLFYRKGCYDHCVRSSATVATRRWHSKRKTAAACTGRFFHIFLHQTLPTAPSHHQCVMILARKSRARSERGEPKKSSFL